MLTIYETIKDKMTKLSTFNWEHLKNISLNLLKIGFFGWFD